MFFWIVWNRWIIFVSIFAAEPIQDKEIHILMRPTEKGVQNIQVKGSDNITAEEVFEVIEVKYDQVLKTID